MNISDDRLSAELMRKLASGDAPDHPPFGQVMLAAEHRISVQRQRYRVLSAAAVLIAAVVIGATAPTQSTSDYKYIEVAELMESTSWMAPSDVLLPDRQFDLYQDLPVLIELSEPDGGA
jgi:hypothetical protein